MDHVRSKVVARIEADWPITLEEWDQDEEFYSSDDIRDFKRRRRLRSAPPEPAAAVVLARRFDMPTILPAAFYELTRRDIHNNKTYLFTELVNQARGDILSSEDYQILSDFRDYLFYATKNLTEFVHVNQECTGDDCLASLAKFLSSLKLDAYNQRDFLRVTRLDNVAVHDLCETCEERVKAEVSQRRANVWADFK